MSDNWQQIGVPASAVKEWTALCYELRGVIEPRVESGDAVLVLEALACVMAYTVSLVHPRHHDSLAVLLEALPDKIASNAAEARKAVGGADIRDHNIKMQPNSIDGRGRPVSNVTRIQDARLFKQCGWPLNTTIEHKPFSREYSRRWFAMLNANVEWVASLLEYAENNNRRTWKRVSKAFETFDRATGRFAEYYDVTKDDGERQIIAPIGQQMLLPISERWDAIRDALGGGEAVTINARELLIEGAP